MKAKFFLKCQSPKVNTGDFMQSVLEICQNNHIDADVFQAVRVSGKKQDEEYGITVKVDQNDVLRLARILKDAFRQEEIVVYHKLPNPPREVETAKVCTLLVPDDSAPASPQVAALTLHSVLQELYRKSGINCTLVVDRKGFNLSIWGVSYGAPNPDAWHRYLQAALKRNKCGVYEYCYVNVQVI